MFYLLYVDDEPGLLEIGKLFLESSGDFSVTTAISAEEGLARLAEQRFDAIISDYQMPEMDGIGFLKNVRQSFGTIPFILFTGRGREEVVIQAINNGADFYLQKGGDTQALFAELGHKIRQAVGRRRAEIALSDSEKRLADLINFLPDATFAIDTEGKVISWNRAIEEMTGIAAKDILGKGDFEYSLPFYGERRPILIDFIFKSDEEAARLYSNILREGATLSAETNLPHPKGEQISVLAKASPLYNSEGQITGAIESIRNITDRKKAEEAQSESERRFRELAELLPQGIYEADTTGRMTYVNRHGLEMFGYSSDDIANGLNVMITIAPVDREAAARAFRRMAEQGDRLSGGRDYEALRKDGSSFFISVFSSPILYDGRSIGVRGIVIDITDRKRAEEELRAVNEQLAASGEELRAQYLELVEGEKQIRESESRLSYLIGFYEYAEKSEKELLSYAVEGAGIVTGSPLGYLAFLNEDESELSMYAWSKTAMAECAIRDKPIIYQTEKTGLWGEAVRQRKPVITNDYGAPNPQKRGYPEGHPSIIRHMNVPVFEGGHIVIVAGVANKSSGYTEHDAGELTLLMQGLWTILKRKRAEQTKQESEQHIRESEEKYRRLVEVTHDIIYSLAIDGTILFVSPQIQDHLGYRPDELEGRQFTEFIHPDDVGTLVRHIRAHVDTGGRYSSDRFRIRGKDGVYRWFNDKTIYTKDRDGHPVVIGTIRDVTEEKAAEDLLYKSEGKFRAIIDNTSQLIGLLNPDGTLIEANQASLAFIGVPAADVINRPFWETPWWSHSAEAQDQLKEGILEAASGKAVRFDTTHSAADGSLVYIDFSINPVKDPTGRVLYLVAEGRDITRRRRTEEALRESEEKHRLIAENSPDMIYFVDTRGYLRYINPLAAKALRARPESIIGKHLSEIFRPEAARHHTDAIFRVMNTRVPLRSEIYEDLPSRSMWIDVRLVPVTDAAGCIIGVLGLSHDISDRKHTEEALRESEEKYRMLVENTHDIIYTINADGTLTFVSPGWTTLLGHEVKDVIGSPFERFVHPADVAVCRTALADVVSSGQRMSGIEYRVFHADGSTRIHTSTIAPIFNTAGKVISYVGNARDITEMKQFQNAIRESNRKLNLLTSITRHDVANQLTVVQGYTQLAALRKPDPVILDFLNKISASIDTIQHQFEFAKAYQDMGAQSPAWFNVRDVIESVRPPLLNLDCTCNSCEIFADPMLTKVFFNLFENAVRYGKTVTTITVRCGKVEGDLVISFADNGVGIPLNEKQKIFEKGYGQHTGFGLFLAREILAITGISISETGSHGRGARFEISVPKGAYRTSTK